MFWWLFLLFATATAKGIAPEKCCWSEQYELTIREYGEVTDPKTGAPVKREAASQAFSDFQNKREAVKYVTRNDDGTRSYGRLVIDYNGLKKYRFSQNGAVCEVSNITTPMELPCISSNATFLESSYLGYGNDILHFNRWYYDIAGTNYGAHFDVSPVGCIPISYTIKGTVNGNITEHVFAFSNYVPGINDPNVFNVPLSCKGS